MPFRREDRMFGRNPTARPTMNMHVPKSQHDPEPEFDAEELAAIEEGLAELDAGKRIPLEDIKAWVASWNTPDELPIPTASTGSARR